MQNEDSFSHDSPFLACGPIGILDLTNCIETMNGRSERTSRKVTWAHSDHDTHSSASGGDPECPDGLTRDSPLCSSDFLDFSFSSLMISLIFFFLQYNYVKQS